jgi:hypothetical protein
MIVKNPMLKITIFVASFLTFVLLATSYLFLEKFLTEEEIVITIINKEKFGDEQEKYLIFTANEVFENSNKLYHGKSNADLVFKKLERGVTYRVTVAGIYLPNIPRLRNIIDVVGIETKVVINP